METRIMTAMSESIDIIPERVISRCNVLYIQEVG